VECAGFAGTRLTAPATIDQIWESQTRLTGASLSLF